MLFPSPATLTNASAAQPRHHPLLEGNETGHGLQSVAEKLPTTKEGRHEILEWQG